MAVLDLTSTGWSEYDEAGNIAISGTGNEIVTGTDVSRLITEQCYIRRDYGSGYFGDISPGHKFKIRRTAHLSYGIYCALSYSNFIGDDLETGYGIASKNLLTLLFVGNAAPQFQIASSHGTGTLHTDTSITLSDSTDYWPLLTRSGATATAVIYDDEAQTSDVDTIQVTEDSAVTYQYLWASSSWADGPTGKTMSVVAADYDLQEGAGGATGKSNPLYGSLGGPLSGVIG